VKLSTSSKRLEETEKKMSLIGETLGVGAEELDRMICELDRVTKDQERALMYQVQAINRTRREQ
jgi:hypothetical protein